MSAVDMRVLWTGVVFVSWCRREIELEIESQQEGWG